jgi:hypothetical protein
LRFSPRELKWEVRGCGGRPRKYLHSYHQVVQPHSTTSLNSSHLNDPSNTRFLNMRLSNDPGIECWLLCRTAMDKIPYLVTLLSERGRQSFVYTSHKVIIMWYINSSYFQKSLLCTPF